MTTYELITKVKANVGKVIIGKESAIDILLIALLSDGHVLIEDVPGSGKTMLSKSFARSLDCKFSRVQFTPDLLPSDITGIKYFNMKSSDFEFIPGPVFSNVILADEINRATPKTQSGLLECMEERQATVDGETHPLSTPFMVIATQNSIENRGVFPLPEAQLDRFLVKINMGYPTREESIDIMDRFNGADPLMSLSSVVSKKDIETARADVSGIFVHHDLLGYITDIVEATRRKNKVAIGASTRSAIALLKASKGTAALNKRRYVIPDDIKAAAPYVLSHRIILKNPFPADPKTAELIIGEILQEIRVPTENFERYKL